MIKYNNKTINDWYFDDKNVIKVYKNNAVCYYKIVSDGGTPSQEPCFAVVEDITQYSDTEFIDVYDKATDKWYKLNNLDQYEQYGVYGEGRNITHYVGKLTIDNGYEYEWDGSEWVSLGEVSESTATLPDVPFMLNYNAKDYDATNRKLPKTDGQSRNSDAVCNYGYHIVDHSADGYITVTGDTRIIISGTPYFNRTNTQTGCTMTIVSKVKTTNANSSYSILTNRGSYSTMNWMWRYPSNGIFLHGSSAYNNPKYLVSTTGQPITASIRISYNGGVKQQLNDWTNNGSYSGNFQYGYDYNGNNAMFCDYTTENAEYWKGDFYWVYMSFNVLTDEQIQQVIDYNEGGGAPEYPKYYTEKDEPENNVVFEDMEEALAYECPWVGMRAIIGGDIYIFDSNNEWSKVPYYYRVEDVTTSAQGGSGWTVTGSSTYNPDLDYYDDYSVVRDSTTYQYKVAKVTIFGYDNFTYYLRSSGYSSNNYVMATNLDEVQTDPTTMNYNDSRAITNTNNFNKAPASDVNLSNYRRVTYNNIDKTVEHTFYVIFYGRYRNNVYGTATLLIPKDQTQENWEQVTFSASTNVGSTSKNLYIDGNNSTSGGTNTFYYRWMVGLPSGSHTSYTNYSAYGCCPSVTSSTFTSVAGGVRQVDYVYTNTITKNLQFRLVDNSGNTITTGDTVYYNMYQNNGCGAGLSYNNLTFPRSQAVTVGGSFYFTNSNNRHYIYGYAPNIQLNTHYYSDNYNTYFDIPYTKLDTEAVTVSYTTYDPNDAETPSFSTKITYPYNGGTTSSTTLTSYDVPYTYPYVVEQTNTMFSATTNPQSFTAGQSSRTVTFTLYPNNRDFSTVADMEAYQYAWEGMIAYVGDTKYKYENGEWTEWTNALPDVPFILNINAKNYDTATKTFAKTNGQLADTDIVITEGTPVLHDGYVTVNRNTRGVITGYQTYFNRDNNNTTLTIISKQRTANNTDCHMFANRGGSNYNWMYRAYNNQLVFHGSSFINGTSVTTQPVIESVRVNSNRTVIFNNYTDNTTKSFSNFGYGNTNSTGVALFAGYTDYSSEWFAGDFYWLYMSQTTLTDEQIQQVIDYNENL